MKTSKLRSFVESVLVRAAAAIAAALITAPFIHTSTEISTDNAHLGSTSLPIVLVLGMVLVGLLALWVLVHVLDLLATFIGLFDIGGS